MRQSRQRPLTQEAIYHWCLTAQASATQVRLSHGNDLFVVR